MLSPRRMTDSIFFWIRCPPFRNSLLSSFPGFHRRHPPPDSR
jgi:hypothetical protein